MIFGDVKGLIRYRLGFRFQGRFFRISCCVPFYVGCLAIMMSWIVGLLEWHLRCTSVADPMESIRIRAVEAGRREERAVSVFFFQEVLVVVVLALHIMHNVKWRPDFEATAGTGSWLRTRDGAAGYLFSFGLGISFSHSFLYYIVVLLRDG